MDNRRAIEIINSRENIDVFYDGVPVWIDGVNDKSVAQITLLSGEKQRKEVSVNMLKEKK